MATILCLFTGCAEHEIDYPVSIDTETSVVTTQNDFLSFADKISSEEPVEMSEITSSEATVETSQTTYQTTLPQTTSSENAVSSGDTPANTPSPASAIPAPYTVENIHNETFLRYESIKSILKPTSSIKTRIFIQL